MINNIALTGRLTKDLDLRYTNNGKAVGSGTLAVDRQFKNAQGEKETDFINFVIWGKSAEALTNFTRKGSLIGLTGRLQVRNYENNEGKRVYVTEVVAENFVFLESKKQAESNDFVDSQGSSNNQSNNGRQSTYEGYKAKEDPFLSSGSPIDIGPDDLPF